VESLNGWRDQRKCREDPKALHADWTHQLISASGEFWFVTVLYIRWRCQCFFPIHWYLSSVISNAHYRDAPKQRYKHSSGEAACYILRGREFLLECSEKNTLLNAATEIVKHPNRKTRYGLVHWQSGQNPTPSRWKIKKSIQETPDRQVWQVWQVWQEEVTDQIKVTASAKSSQEEFIMLPMVTL